MIILKAPTDKDNYIPISDINVNKELQKHGFFPLYWDDDNVMYYKKNIELQEYLEKVGEIFE